MNSDTDNTMAIGPIKGALRTLEMHMKQSKMQLGCSHWSTRDSESLTTAVQLLKRNCVIALPTDTIYGLAALAQSNESISKLYEIKKRDPSKPLAICVGEVSDVKSWAEVDELPKGLLESLLPGPVTLVMKRTPALNPLFNPNVRNVGIRIPDSKFITDIAKTLKQPLALTSANESNKPSTINPDEFSNLWWQLDAIFYSEKRISDNALARAGSTVVDLSEAGKYKILRKGSAESETVGILKKFHLTEHAT